MAENQGFLLHYRIRLECVGGKNLFQSRSITEALVTILKKIANTHGFGLEIETIDDDYVQLFIEVPLSLSLSQIVQYLKDESTSELHQSLWAEKYFASPL